MQIDTHYNPEDGTARVIIGLDTNEIRTAQNLVLITKDVEGGENAKIELTLSYFIGRLLKEGSDALFSEPEPEITPTIEGNNTVH